MTESLQYRFVESRGAPLKVGDLTVVQMDRVIIPQHAIVEIEFVGDRLYADCAAVIAVPESGKIKLSDGSSARAVASWDQPGLPRRVAHAVDSPDGRLDVYHKYRVRHSASFTTEDSFTGNAGIVVSEISANTRLYECSTGPGAFDKGALVFRLSWKQE